MEAHRVALALSAFALLAAGEASARTVGARIEVAAAGQGQPPPQTDAQGNGTLSDKLSNTNGVIHPDSDVDPGIRKAPPATDAAKTPVIPPPGTPGGEPGVQPK
jgi:hypothetical protein